MFLIKPTLTEEEISAKVAFIKEVIEKNGGTIAACDEVGMKKLAYKVEKFDRGYYYVIYFEAPTALNKELERIYRITEEIIRFIIVKFEKQAEQRAWDKMVLENKK
jgi:small subunit ribosomal protein S6